MLCDLWYRNKTKVKLKRSKFTVNIIYNSRQFDCYVNAGQNRWVKVDDDDETDACYQNEKPSKTMTCELKVCRKY